VSPGVQFWKPIDSLSGFTLWPAFLWRGADYFAATSLPFFPSIEGKRESGDWWAGVNALAPSRYLFVFLIGEMEKNWRRETHEFRAVRAAERIEAVSPLGPKRQP
jgi:hypothetical protein